MGTKFFLEIKQKSDHVLHVLMQSEIMLCSLISSLIRSRAENTLQLMQNAVARVLNKTSKRKNISTAPLFHRLPDAFLDSLSNLSLYNVVYQALNGLALPYLVNIFCPLLWMTKVRQTLLRMEQKTNPKTETKCLLVNIRPLHISSKTFKDYLQSINQQKKLFLFK